ncbi:ASCH domain-containing protein [Mangrovibacillus cuniculi]|uniref:ASCH domain-containing protein n=1 Tax=Mangrovibacillus cuniculi TaxID=2593652 RepID=A0A7S8HEJ2_9BACI|nr:ASCH domain-containing protein [Mangrovibacillus cuniculi]QPC45546.1 ASCH domain-containing protein [Mangrovibacillus cuniculi]
MNSKSKEYWNRFWEKQGETAPTSVTAWQFGASPDQLAQLVIDGIKTATCSGYVFYGEDEPLPAVGDYSVVLSSKDEPVAIIKTTSVEVMPMNEVSEDFAISEGEGDRTYEYWRSAHEKFFTKELAELGLEYTEDMMLVCERFELVDKNSGE